MVCSFLFNKYNISSEHFNSTASIYSLRLIILPTIIGGILALKYTVSPKTLRVFLIIYASLWALRYLFLFLGEQLGEVYLFNKSFRFDLIMASYYRTVSRLETPLPFIIFWFINYLFSKLDKTAEKTGDAATELNAPN
jgi:hypothetical protein